MNSNEELCSSMSSYTTCSIEDLKQLNAEVFIKEENSDPAVCLLERNFGSGDEEHCPLALVSTSLGKKKGRKRKVDDENRKFKESWTRNYFFIQDYDKKIVCLICNGSVAVPKVFNLKRHYTSKHKAYDEYKGDIRIKKIRSLIHGYYLQHNDLNKGQQVLDDVTEVGYEIAYLTARSSRPFTDGEFIKSCLLISAKKFCPNVVKKFESVDLKCSTLQGHALNLANDVVRQLRFRISSYVSFSLAVNILPEKKSTSHLLVLVRGVTPNFDIDEELISIRTLEGCVSGNEILTHVLAQCDSIGLDMTKLSGIVTNGSPVLVNPFNGMVPLLIANQGQRKHHLIIYDCLIDYRLLFGDLLQFDPVMKVVVSVIKFIKLNGLSNHLFKAFIEEVEVEYGGIECYADVWWWVNRGTILRTFIDLLDEFVKFFSENGGGTFPDLAHPEWLYDLAFLVDITNHMNTLDTRLHGKDQLVSQLLMHINVFQNKLDLFHAQLHNGELHHFPTCQLMLNKLNHNFGTEKYFEKIGRLKEIIHDRFHVLLKEKLNLHLFSYPFSVSPNEVTPEAQLELIDLQNNSVLRSMFVQETLLNFYKYLSQDQYPFLCEKAAIFSSLFGSTYICDQTYDVTKRMLKQESRPNLQSIVRLVTTNLNPNINVATDHLLLDTPNEAFCSL